MKARLDHVAVAVRGLEDALTFFRDRLGLEVSGTEQVEEQRVRVAFLQVGDAAIELLEPTESDSPVARFLEKRGPGLHHITLAVPDLERTLRDLRARGVRLIDEQPRRGAGGHLIAFLHPSSTGGVLIELKQE